MGGGGRNVYGARTCSIEGAIYGTALFPNGVPEMQWLQGQLTFEDLQALEDYLNSFVGITGEHRYITACAGCHGMDGTGGPGGGSVIGKSASEIRDAIRDESSMQFLGCLPDFDLEEIAAYLQVLRAEVNAPGSVNGANRGLTPVEIEFHPADMDLGRVKIAEVQCGAARDNEMPRFIDPVRVKRESYDKNDFVALFDTRELMLRCEDNKLVCEGTLADGRLFMGADDLRVVRDVDRNRCRAVNKTAKK